MLGEFAWSDKLERVRTVMVDVVKQKPTAPAAYAGAVGGIVSCGHIPAFTRAEVTVSGPAARVPGRASIRSGDKRAT